MEASEKQFLAFEESFNVPLLFPFAQQMLFNAKQAMFKLWIIFWPVNFPKHLLYRLYYYILKAKPW